MKQKFYIMALIALLAFCGAVFLGQPEPEISPLQPKVPDFSFMTLDGKTHQLYDFAGKKIILNFWTTWCAPCIEEMPLLLDMAARDPEKTVLIALSVNETPKTIASFIQNSDPMIRAKFSQNNVYIGMDRDKRISNGLFQSYRYPESYLIDENLVITRKIIGKVKPSSSYNDL